MKTLFLLQLVSTFYMTGLIWFVQIVHYPLFALVGRARFTRYQQAHQLRTTIAVGPMMLTEAATTVAIVYWPPPGMGPAFTWTGVGLLFVVWFSTALLQVPRHQVLASRFSPRHIRSLVISNWLRTIAWTARSVLLLIYLAQIFPNK
ncbi:hypothetical protein [Gimesia maris]|uniref:DUF4149 domain-containing protein n=1 Tax=Gimesia maris TaxID=122 RepID=A0ABX5YMI3_9PLAN|nr:hypothetical protein [Gimesia maris]EDL56427.1 hypothetical protein PM8797T_31033 [Gimesia maris DSM 8797]QEG16785.1 hypothetical protein GmarT_26530 [Gimesia maris]QGQ30060.1 hypothetical protein F1729_16210 [Gimesia maris]